MDVLNRSAEVDEVIDGTPGKAVPIALAVSVEVQVIATSGRIATQSAMCHTTPIAAG